MLGTSQAIPHALRDRALSGVLEAGLLDRAEDVLGAVCNTPAPSRPEADAEVAEKF